MDSCPLHQEISSIQLNFYAVLQLHINFAREDDGIIDGLGAMDARYRSWLVFVNTESRAFFYCCADFHVTQEELCLLEMIHHHLDIDRLSAAVIERGSRAHYILP